MIRWGCGYNILYTYIPVATYCDAWFLLSSDKRGCGYNTSSRVDEPGEKTGGWGGVREVGGGAGWIGGSEERRRESDEILRGERGRLRGIWLDGE